MKFNSLRDCLHYINDNFDTLKEQRETNWARSVASMMGELSGDAAPTDSSQGNALVPSSDDDMGILGFLRSMRTSISRSILTEYLGIIDNPLAAFIAFAPEVMAREHNPKRKKTKRNPETLMQLAEDALDKMGFTGFEYHDHTDSDIWLTGTKQDGTKRTLRLVGHHAKRAEAVSLLQTENALLFPYAHQQIEVLPFVEEYAPDKNDPARAAWNEHAFYLAALLHHDGRYACGDMDGLFGDGPEIPHISEIGLVGGIPYIFTPHSISKENNAPNLVEDALRLALTQGTVQLPAPDKNGIILSKYFVCFGSTDIEKSGNVKKWAARKKLHVIPLIDEANKQFYVIYDPAREQDGQVIAKSLRASLQSKRLPRPSTDPA